MNVNESMKRSSWNPLMGITEVHGIGNERGPHSSNCGGLGTGNPNSEKGKPCMTILANPRGNAKGVTDDLVRSR